MKCFCCGHSIITWEQTPRYASVDELVKEYVEEETGEMQQRRLDRNPLASAGYDYQYTVIAIVRIFSLRNSVCYNCGRALSAEDIKRLLADDIVRTVLMNSAQDVPPDQNTPPEL